MSTFITYKNLGETPLEALERVREENNISPTERMTYAGRLDPAAEGTLLILSGDDVHKKESLNSLPKTYIAEIVFGIQTDTDDLLGICEEAQKIETAPEIKNVLPKFLGTRMQSFHQFSSKSQDGKPLWEHARENNHLEIPEHSITIDEISIFGESNITREDLLLRIGTIASMVKQDFRQKEILASFENLEPDSFPTAILKISCSSGTYIRVLVREISEVIKVPIVIGKLVRTSVGEFSAPECAIL